VEREINEKKMQYLKKKSYLRANMKALSKVTLKGMVIENFNEEEDFSFI
jgi:hypothetical protein